MKQESLFDATLYVQRAYENLVLAYDAWELQEIAMLKNAVMRGWMSVAAARDEQLKLYPNEDDDSPY